MSGVVRKKLQIGGLTMPNSNQSLALLMLRSPMGLGMAPELHPDVWSGQKKFQMTNFSMPYIVSSIKYSLKSVPGLTDVGVPHGDGDGPRAPP